MAEQQIRFDDGALYERSMGEWSRLAGEIFLQWLAPSPSLRWVDVGCGSGAFTELIIQQCAPAEVDGIDPSEGQLGFARARPGARMATFRQGDAMALPYADDSFDAGVMALVLFFVPDPAKGLAEMARVVRAGGMVAAYLWDFGNAGFPFHPIQAELRAMGHTPPLPPSVQASRMDVLHDLWTQAGLTAIESRTITVSRSFSSFDDFWSVSAATLSSRAAIDRMTASEVERLKSGVSARLPADPTGRITYQSTANAIRGNVAS